MFPYRESKNLEESGFRRRLGRCLWVPCPSDLLWLACCFLWLLSVVNAVPAACSAEDSCTWLHLLNGTSEEIGLVSTQTPLGLVTSVERSDPPHAHTTHLSLVQFLVVLDVLMLLWEESWQVLEWTCCPCAVVPGGHPISRLLIWLAGSLEELLLF